MNIHYVHFYVEDAQMWRDWFIHTLGFQSLATRSTPHTHTEVVGTVALQFVLSAALSDRSPVAEYLRQHPPGIVDLAFRVTHLESLLDRALDRGMRLLRPLEVKAQPQGDVKWAQVKGWGDLNHTLIEVADGVSGLPIWECSEMATGGTDTAWTQTTRLRSLSEEARFIGIDHVVLNVAAGDLEKAVTWYETVLGFQRQQAFMIQTEYSALCSQVLVHPDGTVQMPINEPASPSSQIQEFLDLNRGAGIQHLALRTVNLVRTIAQLRQQGLSFLQVPPTYYHQLQQRPGFQLSEAVWQAIAQQEVLVDWQKDLPEAMLLQTFTQPIFGQPTFFFEFIERQVYRVNQQYHQAQGFGEGNFRALFEAIEREQMKRGSLS
jgi:4-hydroxyphenylpyruvate dioxygenase